MVIFLSMIIPLPLLYLSKYISYDASVNPWHKHSYTAIPQADDTKPWQTQTHAHAQKEDSHSFVWILSKGIRFLLAFWYWNIWWFRFCLYWFFWHIFIFPRHLRACNIISVHLFSLRMIMQLTWSGRTLLGLRWITVLNNFQRLYFRLFFFLRVILLNLAWKLFIVSLRFMEPCKFSLKALSFITKEDFFLKLQRELFLTSITHF